MSVERELLKAGKALLARGPEFWCKEYYSVNEKGEGVSWRNPKTCRFCLWGSLLRAKFDCNASETDYDLAEWFLMEATPTNSLPYFNDHPTTTYSAVLDVYDQAIALAEESANAKVPPPSE